MAFQRIIHRADEMLLVDQGHALLGFFGGDDFRVHAEIAAFGMGHFQPIHPVFGASEHDAAGQMQAAGDAR